ncbi:MAG: hypothetical protein ACRCSS_15455 [Shewanella sp.]
MNSNTKSRSDVVVPLAPKEAKDLIPVLLQIVERLKVTTVVEPSSNEVTQFDTSELEDSIAAIADKVDSISMAAVKSRYSVLIGSAISGSPPLQAGVGNTGQDARYVDVVLPTAVNPDKCWIDIAGGIRFSGFALYDLWTAGPMASSAFSPYGNLGETYGKRQYYYAPFVYRFINPTTLRLSCYFQNATYYDSYDFMCQVTVLEFT